MFLFSSGIQQIASQQQSVTDVTTKKIGDNPDDASSASTEAISTCVVTGGDQLLESSNSVLNVHTIVSSPVDQNLVSYASE